MCSKFLLKLLFIFIFLGCTSPLDNLSALHQKIPKIYEQKLKNNPENFKLRLKLAEFYYKINNYRKAKALLGAREERKAKIILAKSYAQLRDYTRAYEVFEKLGELKDDEYLYLYGLTCEEKNLFPRAVELYKKLGPSYRKAGEERIRRIGIRIEDGLPPRVKQLLKEEEEFIAKIDKEEAVVLLADEAIEINEDNTSVFSLHLIEKILKEKGKELGEVTVGYDSTHQRVELDYARTITPQGKVVYAGAENIRDVSKYLNFPLYSNARAFLISMPAVEVGAIIEYKVKIYSAKLVNVDDFTFVYRLKENYPVGQANFQLSIPKGRGAKFKSFNENYAGGVNFVPAVKEEKTRKVYRWEFKNLPPLIPEEEMPPLSFVNPAMVISSFSSWGEIYQWWKKLFKDKFSLSTETKKFLRGLLKGCRDDLEKAKRIYRFCAQNIRYVGVEYGESGYEPHSAEEVFWNRYGDCKDQAILLAALLREAGLKAYPVLIPTREAYPIGESFPALNFNHAICVFSHNGKSIFLDATSPTTSFLDLPLGDQERNVLVFFEDSYKIATTPRIKKNKLIFETEIRVDKNEDAYAERKVAAEGFFSQAQRFYFKYSHPEKIKEDIQKRIVQISPFSKLLKLTIDNLDDFDRAAVLRYSFRTKKILSPAENLRILPALGDIDIPPALIGKDERVFPVDFGGTFKKVSKIKIYLPSNLKVKYLPRAKTLETAWFGFKARYKEERNTLSFFREFTVKKRFVGREEYKEFKRKLEEAACFLKEEAVLEKTR